MLAHRRGSVAQYTYLEERGEKLRGKDILRAVCECVTEQGSGPKPLCKKHDGNLTWDEVDEARRVSYALSRDSSIPGMHKQTYPSKQDDDGLH